MDNNKCYRTYVINSHSQSIKWLRTFGGVCWILLAELRCDAVCHRVESASNIAAGPTRPEKEGCQVLELVGTVEESAFLAGG